jgi:hypothetical protein
MCSHINHSYYESRVYNTSLNIKRSKINSKPLKILAKPCKYPPKFRGKKREGGEEKKKRKDKRKKRNINKKHKCRGSRA